MFVMECPIIPLQTLPWELMFRAARLRSPGVDCEASVSSRPGHPAALSVEFSSFQDETASSLVEIVLMIMGFYPASCYLKKHKQ